MQLMHGLVHSLSDRQWKYLEIAKPVECRHTAHFEQFFQEIVDKGGEGVILRDPAAPYQPGLSTGFLKHKVGVSSPIL